LRHLASALRPAFVGVSGTWAEATEEYRTVLSRADDVGEVVWPITGQP
jgi:hypothetical protein